MKSLVFAIALFSVGVSFGQDQQTNYPIVAVRQPRHDDTTYLYWTEVNDPTKHEAGSDLVVINPDGSERVLVAGGPGAITDPSVSLDGQFVYYSQIPNLSTSPLGTYVNPQKGPRVATGGCDIYKINVATGQITQLTRQEWTPNTGVANWTLPDPNNAAKKTGAWLGYGIYNMMPCELPNGRIMFSSTRNGFIHNGAFTAPMVFQLFVMDADGSNVEQIGYLNQTGGLHPTLLQTGEVAFSSGETQGYHAPGQWGLWSIWPDGRQWGPLLSAFFNGDFSSHFATQMTDGRIVTAHYYEGHNNGFGTLLAFQENAPAGQPRFGSPNPALDPKVTLNWKNLSRNYFQVSFSPFNLTCLTPFADWRDDFANKDANGNYLGKVTHPAAGPNNDLVCVYSPGPCHNKVYATDVPTPYYWGQIALIPGGTTLTDLQSTNGLQIVRAVSGYSYQLPKPLVPWSQIHGSPAVTLPENMNDGTVHPALPAGTPFGLIGTSSLYKRDSATFYPNTAWFGQGADSGVYQNSDIYSFRILQMEPQSYRSYTNDGSPVFPNRVWTSGLGNPERMLILAEIPVRKPDANGVEPLDPDGNPDTSFLAKIPGDVPFTFQTLDKNGFVLDMAETWHQVRPGEVRNDCGGCHAHSQLPTDFSKTAAASTDYLIQEYMQAHAVEFTRDVLPILEEHCVACHDASNTSGLNMQVADGGYSQLLKRLKAMRPRESLLAWKLYGKPLDGLTGSMSGTQMPPPSSNDTLTAAEIRTIIDWISLGATNGPLGYQDDLRPTLTIQSPPRTPTSPATQIVFGAVDTESGLDATKTSVTADFAVNGRAAGAELSDLFGAPKDSVWSLILQTPVPSGVLTISVADKQGNITRLVRKFKTDNSALIAALQSQISALQAQIAATEGMLAQQQAQLASLQAQLQQLQGE
ncbi:MAG: hypothetical protein KGL39_41650 [Patescibacteria group bacterium]|nr:hypothetical protein [Patescibacteria group bacterium]